MTRDCSKPKTKPIKNITQAITQKVEAKADDDNGNTGNRGNPPLFKQELTAIGNHGTPFGHRRLCTKAKEAKTGRKPATGRPAPAP